MNPPQAELLDLYRTGLKNAADVMKSSLETAERLQQEQLAAIRGALQQQSSAVSRLTQATTLEDLLAVQQQMAGAQFERAMGYWTSLCQIAGDNQVAAISQAHAQMAQARDWFNETYALTARATEEAAKLATATAGVKQKAQERRSA